MPVVLLSPPWYTFANEIKYTYGLSSYVKVNELVNLPNGDYLLNINVSNNEIAIALRQILPINVDFSGVNLYIVIYDSVGNAVKISNESYTAETLADLFCIALKGNPLLVGTVLVAGPIPTEESGITVVIEKEVVQFYNDDIGDLCLNFNEVASKVFGEVSNKKFTGNVSVAFSTYDPKCKLQKKIYCQGKGKKCFCNM